MEFHEILLIIVIVSFVCFVFGKQIYNKITHKPSDECSCCAMKSKRMIKIIKIDIEKEKKCCCNNK